ncbi:uncharacterized protein LOC125025240 [Penaeus chinensis]|uniref:uncharacterized protein LOC125025240 n=1 Tax=Penaeus chinensis TaxID=139456 RepID=UPI001FB71D21|nr:uncharacterized protein LOC125025240 [Penaeus chinensis]
MADQRISDRGKASPVSDAQVYRRTLVRNGLRLPYQERTAKEDSSKKRKRKEEKSKGTVWRLATLNVGSMTGRGREIVDFMEKRKINIMCVQETKWKGAKAKELGNGFKLFYTGTDRRRNGVGIILDDNLYKGVLSVK